MKSRSVYSRFVVFEVFMLLIVLPCLNALAAEPAAILIKNVLLIDREAIAEDAVVNILIRDNKLELVTRQEIPAEEVDLAVDARGGFLLGSLSVGDPPSFLILGQDPRKNFEVLRDTRAYEQFAMDKGAIVKNNLQQLAATQPAQESESRRSAWLAYEPPPLALPLSYHDNRKWNKFETRYISGLFNGALALDRTRWLSQSDGSRAQVGDLSEFDGGEIRALRFGLAGTLNFRTPWVYVIAGATNGFDKGFDTTNTDDFTWFDYRVDIPVFKDTTLSIGKQKEPISLERLTGMVFLPWQERSAPADSFFPGRNHGIMLNGTGPNGWMTWAAGAFNNWIDSEESFDDTANQLAGRITWVPFASADESNLLHLGLGIRHTDAKQGIRYQTEPEFKQSPTFADTGLLTANKALTYNAEAYWRKGPYWLGFEYILSDVDSPEFGNPSFDGYHISASWALTGEMRSYRKRSGVFNPLPVAKSVNQGGWGAWELAARYSSLDLFDGLVDGGDMNISSVGLNWWLTRVAQFSVNYRHITLNQEGIEGNSSGFASRIVLILD